MNKNNHRLIFNASRGCTMAVAETASSCSKNPSGTSKACRRAAKCSKSAKSDEFTLSKVPLAQWIRAQAAINSVVSGCPTHNSKGNTNLQAGNTLTLQAGQKTNDMAWGGQTSSSGFLSSSTTTRRETGSSTQAVGTNVGGNTVNVTANQDINIKGSSVIADTNATLSAGNNINIEVATNTARNTSFVETKESGFLSGGGFGISYGKREQSTDQKNQNTTAAASTVGAIGGNININAGQTFRQVGSDIVAPTGDINITAKKVDIVEARETSQTTTEQKFKQTAITVGVSSPVISALQNAQAMSKAASQTSDGRMQALAAASTALNVYNNAKDIGQAIADPVGSASINVSIGSSKSQSNSTSQSDTAQGSSIAAGNNINITATGTDKSAGQQSDILIQGSEVKAANNTTLTADNKINLLAARNESSQTSINSNSSSSIGASFSAKGISANASVSRGSGKSDGQDTTFTNTQVQAGNTATIKSGGDTNVIGAVVEANRIKADIGGSLKVESLQDTSTFTSSQKSANASISVPITGGSFGGSVGASKSHVDSNFQSVGQQSGLKAANGGFQVDVAKNTALVGAVIASTQGAVDNNKNTFTTGGSLTITDIQNTASFKGKAVGVSLGVGSALGKSGAGVGSLSGNASSTSSAGISGIAGNTAVRSGDAETGLKPIFDADKVQKDIDAQVKITMAFGQQASKTIGDYATNQLKEATLKKEQALLETDPVKRAELIKQANDAESVWGEGKPGRAALHGIVGALTGGLGGAIGSTAASMGMPILSAQIDELPISESAKQALNQIAVLALLSSNASAAAAGLNTDANNRAAHAKETALIKAKSAEFAAKLRDRGYDVTPEKAQSILSEIVDNRIDYTAAKKSDVETGNDAIKAEAQKYLNQIGKAEGTFKDESGVERQYFSSRDVQGNFNEKDFYNPALFSTIKKAEEGKFTGTISAGAYLGLGGEIELKFEQGQVTEVKGVLGAGIGAKTLAIPKQSLNDSGVGYKAEIPAFLSSGDIQPGEGPSSFSVEYNIHNWRQ
jgi:filamentous hemagglutinin